MKVYQCIVRANGNADAPRWPKGSLTTYANAFFSTADEARQYFTNEKLNYYKNKQRWLKAVDNNEVDWEKLKQFQAIIPEIGSLDVKPYYYDFVGVAEINVLEQLPETHMTVQEKRISDYIRWGLTQKQAEDFVIRDIYPMTSDEGDRDHALMKSVRLKRWAEKDSKQVAYEEWSKQSEDLLRELRECMKILEDEYGIKPRTP